MGIWRGAPGNWSTSFWCVCFVVTLVISIVDYVCSGPSFLSSGAASLSPTPVAPPSSVSRPPSPTLSPLSRSCLMVLTGTGPSLPLGSPLSHLCCVPCKQPALDHLLVQRDLLLCAHHARPAEGAGDLYGWFHLRLHHQHLPVPAPAGPGVECGRVLHLLHPSSLAILLNLGEWECRLPGPFPLFQLVLSLLSVLLYVSTLVLWPLYPSSMRSLADSPSSPVIWAASVGSPTTCTSETSDWLWPSQQRSTC